MITPDILLVRKLMARQDLTRAESAELVETILREDDEGFKILAFSVASQSKGETIDEMMGMLDAMAALTGPYDVDLPPGLMDISSAGGSGLKKINVSPLASLVVGEPGLPIAKHSFFRVTSVAGSADAMRAVGIEVPAATLPQIAHALRSLGVAFYSPLFVSPELKNLVHFGLTLAAKGVGVSTPFHMLAPIFSPLRFTYRMFGLNGSNSFEMVTAIFRRLGYRSALVVRGFDGLDEVSLASPTRVMGFLGGEEVDFVLEPEQVGLKTVPQEALQPADAGGGMRDFVRIAHGAERGPKRDLVALNSALAFYLAGRAPSIAEGVELAVRRLESGEVGEKLAALVKQMGSPEVLAKAKRDYL